MGAPDLSWSAELAAFAAEWAGELARRGCRLEHRARSGPFAQRYGENLFWASPLSSTGGAAAAQSVAPAAVVDDWAAERQWYRHDADRCSAPAGRSCGHYTQVVWSGSTAVGCARATCADRSQVWVCNYAPAGNLAGRRPY